MAKKKTKRRSKPQNRTRFRVRYETSGGLDQFLFYDCMAKDEDDAVAQCEAACNVRRIVWASPVVRPPALQSTVLYIVGTPSGDGRTEWRYGILPLRDGDEYTPVDLVDAMQSTPVRINDSDSDRDIDKVTDSLWAMHASRVLDNLPPVERDRMVPKYRACRLNISWSKITEIAQGS